MEYQELDRRLAACDPALPTSASLDADLVDFFELSPLRAKRHPWRKAVAVGGAIAIVGSLAAAINLDDYFLSRPPFSTLSDGEIRVPDGLPYTPVGQTDQGEKCEIFVDFAGLTAAEFTAVDTYWKAADPEAFAAGVNDRLDSIPTTDVAEGEAKRQQLLEGFSTVVPGLVWGTAPPSQPFTAGNPHLATFTTVCADDKAALGW